MRPALALLAAAAPVLGLTLGGCGLDVTQGDDVEPDARTVRSGLVTLYGGPEAEAGCFADALLGRLSLDELTDAGIVRDDGRVAASAPMLESGVAEAWVDAMTSCTSYAEAAARGSGLPEADRPAYVACLDRAVPADVQHQAMVAALTGRYGSDPTSVRLARAEASCASTGRE